MKPFDSELLDMLDAGQVDYRDAIELVFDSGVVRLFIGGRGQFGWDDTLGVLPPWDGEGAPPAIFYGGGSLVSLDVPANALGPQSQAITARVFETYMAEGSDVPVNTFDDDVRATIDEEPWQGRPAVLSIFWIGPSGLPIYREQVAVREMDAMPIETDQEGNVVRSLVLEEPDITQRDVEGKTANAAFQALVDPTDLAFEHVGTTVRQMQKINFGRIEGAA
ncbi:hypothetical protein PSC71_08410 [Devosia sp. J2-20]|uniref:hypothetical protein n=1 Tax=Devosia sp. J2-20 TaxID=3026161 RepID=UPI002499E076|nr:hypothetical protein [Devosia sp. J2-20]WDR00756.1 hypothetical protein PSC71_08410 [Devosia sp. J2-20]